MCRKYKVLIILLFTQINVYQLYAQKITLVETKRNTIQKKFNNVLIIGAGPSATRLFLDNLTEKLIEELHKKEINATYYYDGNVDRNTQIDLKKLIDEKFDGYIVFNISDTSQVTRKSTTLPLSIPISGGRGIASVNVNYSRLKYAEDFYIQFFEFANTSVSIWEGVLKLDFDFSKARLYSSITDLLIKSLYQNKLL